MRLRVSLVQLGVEPAAQAARAMDEVAAAIQEGADRGAGLVVLPQAVGSTDPQSQAVASWDGAIRLLGQAARHGGVWVVAGLVRPPVWEDGPHQGVCALFDPAGDLAAVVPGPVGTGSAAPAGEGASAITAPIVDTAIGRLGLLLGDALADPVPARRLAEAGVSALIVPSALGAPNRLAAAERQAAIDRPRARARENGVAVLVADWSGRVGTRRLLGTTAAYGPGGTRLASVAPGHAGVALADVEIPLPLLRRSRGARMPATPPRVPPSPRRRLVLAVAQGPDHGTWAPAALPAAPDLLVTPLVPRGTPPQAVLARVSAGRARATVAGRAVREVLRGDRFVAGQRTLDVAAARVGVVFGDEITAPEPARLLAATGAQVLVLFAEALDIEDAQFWARVRARENAVAAVVCARAQGTLIAPDGRIAAEGAVRRSAVVMSRMTVGGTRRRLPSQASV
jgi:predicted amidohydrolase